MTDTAQPDPRETPSPVFNELLGLLRAVLAGQSPPEPLARFVAELVPRFEAARDQTRERIVGAGPEHLEKFAEPIARIEAAFAEVDSALQAVRKYAENRVAEVGERALLQVRRAAWSQRLAMDAYQQAELADGPTRMPLVNLLIRMKDGYLAGSVSPDDFQAAIRGAQRMSSEAQQEIRGQPKLTDAMESMIAAYERMKATLSELESAIPAGAEALESAIQGVVFASETVRGAMENLNTRILTAGPTRMEHANLVLNIAAAHQARQVPDQVLLNALSVFRRGIEQEMAEVEKLLSLPTQSSSVAEQAERTRQAYEMHGPALELMDAYASGAADRYEDARQALIQASEALADCREAFQQIGELEGKVLCVKCGAPNEQGARACGRCGARMVQQAGMSSSTMTMVEGAAPEAGADDLMMTENLYRLFEAVNQVAEGQLPEDEFAEVLQWMHGLVQEHILGLPPSPAFSRDGLTPEQVEQVREMEDELARHREALSEAAEEFLTSLHRMSCFLDDQDKQHLISGVQMCRDAAVKIQKSQAAIESVAGSVQSSPGGATLAATPLPPGEDEGDSSGESPEETRDSSLA